MRRNSWPRLSRLFAALWVGLSLAACGVVAPPTPTSTPSPVPTDTATLEPTNCPYVQNPGPAPAEVVTRAQAAFAATGLPGEVRATGYGEYSCEHFGLMGVDFEIRISAPDLTDFKAMAAQAAQVASIPQDALQNTTQLGNFNIQFRTSDNHFCWWNTASQTCGDVMTGP